MASHVCVRLASGILGPLPFNRRMRVQSLWLMDFSGFPEAHRAASMSAYPLPLGRLRVRGAGVEPNFNPKSPNPAP